jgi:hypothetical protein
MADNPVQNQLTVLRLQPGQHNAEDWAAINGFYDKNQIAQIPDSSASSRKEITSIPTPFARMHLFETAFQVVASQATNNLSSLEGNTMYHKLVSDALDMGELFFNLDGLNANPDLTKRWEVMRWNKTQSLNDLRSSANGQHKLLADTLELYIKQDSRSSNMNDIENLYLLSFQHRVVGGSSPMTLYFTSANDLSFVDVVMGNDRLLDDIPAALHKRSFAFQEYLHLLFKVAATQGIALQTKMKSFWEYLQRSKEQLQWSNPAQFSALQMKLNDAAYQIDAFSRDYEASDWEIFPGFFHRKKKAATDVQSSLKVRTTKYTSGAVPLVLVPKFPERLPHFEGVWNPETPVEYEQVARIEDRLVPGQTAKYPWLCVSDLLEPTLIRLVYPMNKVKFFVGNTEGFFEGDKARNEEPEASYLLPIKPAYFKYFDTKDLMGTMPDGKPAFRMVKVGADSVRVELRIPIQAANKYVTVERLYKSTLTVPDTSKNDGNIVEQWVNIAFLPFATGRDAVESRVALIDNNTVGAGKTTEYALSFYTNVTGASIEPDLKTTASDKNRHQHNATSKYYVLKKNYDFVQLQVGTDVRGLILPTFPTMGGGQRKFIFSIDFGTTNSHIEYIDVANSQNPLPFDIAASEQQIIPLYDIQWEEALGASYPMLRDMLLHELIPNTIGGDSLYQFPIRTSVCEIESLQHGTATFPLGDINIPFYYEKRAVLQNTKITTNLKWVNWSDTANSNRVNAFLETLLILIRNKVLINSGDIGATEIIWTYPSSMSTNQKNNFARRWNDLYKKHINPSKATIDYSESEVPFYSYNAADVKSMAYPVVNIDIGGGTSDIVIFEQDKPRFLTSVKFAGNVPFGDGYATTTAQDNGFVKVFSPKVKEFLSINATPLNKLVKAYEQLSNTNKYNSADIMAFFFSIENNRDVKNANLNFSFSNIVADDPDFKIVTLVFYGAIVYHVAVLMKQLNCKMPRNICFSGNGSRIINLLDTDARLGSCARLARLIFEKVYNQPYHTDGLDLFRSDAPKEATCKGAIRKFQRGDATGEFDNIVLIGGKTPKKETPDQLEYRYINEEPRNYPQSNLTYNDLTEETKQAVCQEVTEFVDLLFSINAEFSFKNKFGINVGRLEDYKAILKRDIMANLLTGLSARLKITDAAENVAESLFFYPLVAGIYELTREISRNR